MAECPKCKKEIDSLQYEGKAKVTQTFGVSNAGYPEYSSFNELGDHSDTRYRCPECYKLLAKDEDKAMKFLERQKKIKDLCESCIKCGETTCGNDQKGHACYESS